MIDVTSVSREDEELEFQRLTSDSGNVSSIEPLTKKSNVGFDESPIDEETECEEDNPGKLVQYAYYGQGYIPATPTTEALPPGVYNVVQSPVGAYFLPHAIVTDRLLRLPDSRSDDVISEIEKFWPLKDRFKEFGFTHKRGILLWGPPGSGKTATISFIIKQMIEGGDIVVLANDQHPSVVANALGKLREIEPERRAIVVMEDIDTIIDSFGEAEVLSLLDGEASIDNVVFLATTNYPENLDGRVVNRPSRFDRVVKIGMPNAQARKMYLESRNLGEDVDIDAWVAATDGFSIAHLKELIVGVCCYGNPFKIECERLRRMFQRPNSSMDRRGIGFNEDSEVGEC